MKTNFSSFNNSSNKAAGLLLALVGLLLPIQAGLLDLNFGNNGSTPGTGSPSPVTPPPTIDDIILQPRPGETLEILYRDEGTGVIYYKATADAYQRAAYANIAGQQGDIVPNATKIYFSPQEWKLYWATPDTLETISLNGANHEILVQNPGYAPNAFGWTWFSIGTAWTWNHNAQDWHYLSGNPMAIDATDGSWKSVWDLNLDRWIWLGDFPWVFVPSQQKWYFLVGDLWSYPSTTENWKRVESNKAPRADGTLGPSHFEADSGSFFYQLNPLTGTGRTFGSIEKLNVQTKSTVTSVEMTNALHITSLPNLGEIYWSETDGVHSAPSVNDQTRRILLQTPTPNTQPPILYEDAAPASAGSLFNLEINQYAPTYQRLSVDFLQGNQFRMGYGKNYLSGTFSWFKTGAYTARLSLHVEGDISVFNNQSIFPINASTVQEAYQMTLGGDTVDLPRSLDLDLSFRDSVTGEAVSTEILASNNLHSNVGKFTATGGDFSGIPRTFPQPLSLPGASVQDLNIVENQSQIIAHLLDAAGNPIQETLYPINQ